MHVIDTYSDIESAKHKMLIWQLLNMLHSLRTGYEKIDVFVGFGHLFKVDGVIREVIFGEKLFDFIRNKSSFYNLGNTRTY